MNELKHLVLGSRPWSRSAFPKLAALPGEWTFLDTEPLFDVDELSVLNPDLIFVMHWSSIIPEVVVSSFECVGFHMTDLPYGRGGSPLQNLIVRGHRSTKLSAIKLTSDVDAGPLYMQRDLDLSGSAEEIYNRMTSLEVEMIEEFLRIRPVPVVQEGDPVLFRRRTPEESDLSTHSGSIEAVYDFIRMLDAPGYPRAFIDSGPLRLEFGQALEAEDGSVRASVTIRKRE